MTERKNYKIGDFNKIEYIPRKIKEESRDYTPDKEDLYNSLINLVVNHKMELQKIPAASHLNSATRWAEKRGLRAGEQDFDKDGKPETVIYNRLGQPVIINGYKLRPSDYGPRHRYWGANPTRSERITAGPMREWITEKSYNVKVDEEKPWLRDITRTEFGNDLEKLGYKMPTKPKSKLNIFSHFCKLIAPYVKRYFDSGALVDLLGEDATPSCAAILKKLISPITIYRMLYMKIVERWYFFHLRRGEMKMSYDEFKKYCKKHTNDFWTFYVENILVKDNFNKFKENIVNDDLIGRLFVKDDLDWDMNDADDAILFLIGEDNVNDEYFKQVMKNEKLNEDDEFGAGNDFYESLSSSDPTTRRMAQNQLEGWKEAARAGTKEFFKKLSADLFENDGAYERYESNIAAGLNPIDPANDERAAPASPEKSVESRTAKPIQVEEEEDAVL